MKKYLTLLLVFVLFLLTACSGTKEFREDITCEDIMNSVVDATVHPESDKIYLKSQDNLDAYGLSLWSDGLYQESEEIDLLSDYAIFTSAGTTTYEVAVLKAESSASVERIEELVNRRKETLALGDKGMYDPSFNIRMENSVVQTVGDFVILFITDDNDTALDEIEKLK